MNDKVRVKGRVLEAMFIVEGNKVWMWLWEEDYIKITSLINVLSTELFKPKDLPKGWLQNGGWVIRPSLISYAEVKRIYDLEKKQWVGV